MKNHRKAFIICDIAQRCFYERIRGKIMNDVIKTLLYSYPSFDKVLESTDRLVYYKALTSYRDNAKTCSQIDEIIRLNECSSRVNLIKGVIDRLLGELEDIERQMIEYKYFRAKKSYDFDPTNRAYFRKQLRLEKKIERKLEYLNPTEEWFTENFGDIYFLNAKYLRIKKLTQEGKKNAGTARNI